MLWSLTDSMLAVAALTIGTATVPPISSTAIAGGGGPDKWCGAPICPQQNSPMSASWPVSRNRRRPVSQSSRPAGGLIMEVPHAATDHELDER